jgi:AraC family transcriptional regulator of adaptative response / DNA-3-methyladenine glycosylase II
MRLLFEPPLDWEALLGYMRAHAIGGVETVSDGTYRRTIEIDGDPGVLEFSREGPDHLVLRAHIPHWEGLIHLVERARHVFNLDADAEAAQRQLAADPRIGRVLANHPGLRPPGVWDPFEIGIRAILEQEAEAGVGTIMERLVTRYGILVPGLQGVGLSHLFPAPSILASAGLGGLGLTPNSVSTIHAFARSVADGALQLDCSIDLDRFVDSVRRAVPGLQQWWADYIALRLGEPDAFPAGDAGIEHYLSHGIKRPSVTWKFTAGTADRWRPWRAYAATAIWFDEHQPVDQSIEV